MNKQGDEANIAVMATNIDYIKKDILTKSFISTPIFYPLVKGMFFNVLTVTRKKLQIFKAIIGSIPIYMMDNFSFDHKSFQKLLHNKPMFRNIPFVITKRMVWLPEMNISPGVNLITLTCRTTQIRTFLRTIFPFMSLFISKFFSTFHTISSCSSYGMFTLSTAIGRFIRRRSLKSFLTKFTSINHCSSFYKITVKETTW